MRNARVFISCGQGNRKEKGIGKSVQDYFAGRGFETYFAEAVHSSEGLTENIFRFLNQSEYFVFIDFKRENLSANEHRGSLFVNQEIAMATFLNLIGVGFVEKGVKREGILEYRIYNAIPFEDETEIINSLDGLTKDWDINSVNELLISYNPEATSRNVILNNHPQKPLTDWYHLEVFNRNKRKHTFSCMGYITHICDLKTGQEFDIPTNEIMWAGIQDITANIMGGTKRDLDAFFIIQGEDQIHFHQRSLGTNNPRYLLQNLSKGNYEIEYTVISSNFDTFSKRFIIDFQEGLEKLEFREA